MTKDRIICLAGRLAITMSRVTEATVTRPSCTNSLHCLNSVVKPEILIHPKASWRLLTNPPTLCLGASVIFTSLSAFTVEQSFKSWMFSYSRHHLSKPSFALFLSPTFLDINLNGCFHHSLFRIFSYQLHHVLFNILQWFPTAYRPIFEAFVNRSQFLKSPTGLTTAEHVDWPDSMVAKRTIFQVKQTWIQTPITHCHLRPVNWNSVSLSIL